LAATAATYHRSSICSAPGPHASRPGRVLRRPHAQRPGELSSRWPASLSVGLDGSRPACLLAGPPNEGHASRPRPKRRTRSSRGRGLGRRIMPQPPRNKADGPHMWLTTAFHSAPASLGLAGRADRSTSATTSADAAALPAGALVCPTPSSVPATRPGMRPLHVRRRHLGLLAVASVPTSPVQRACAPRGSGTVPFFPILARRSVCRRWPPLVLYGLALPVAPSIRSTCHLVSRGGRRSAEPAGPSRLSAPLGVGAVH